MGRDKINPDEIRPYSVAAEETFDYSRVEPFIGVGSEFHEGHDEVSESDIRHWCEVMRDSNPLYTDEEFARESKYGGIIAPPQMVQTWSLDPMAAALQRFVHDNPPFPEDPHNQVFKLIDAMGYHGVVATAQTQEYMRPVRPGDQIRYRITIGGISKYEHYTGRGGGRYVDIIYTFINQNGEEVGVASFRVLKYRPPLETRRLYAG